MTRAITYLFSSYNRSHEAKWFRRLLYLFLLFKCIYWAIDFNLFFGQESIITRSYHSLTFIRSLAYLLFYSTGGTIAILVLTGCFTLCINGIFFNFFPRITAFLAWFFICNINNTVYPSLTAGDFLFQQLLIFNILLSSQKEIKHEGLKDADKALHNFGETAIMFQICIVYFISGLSKFLNADWMSGLAVMQTAHAEDFSIPALYHVKEGGFFAFLNYFVMGYQLVFPLAIWFKKIKKWFLLLGIIQHLYIAFIMGLPSFGFIMIIAYSIFYFPGNEYQNKFIN